MYALLVVLKLSSAICALKAKSVRADAVPGVRSEQISAYTPAEVSRILAKLLDINADTAFSATAYDPPAAPDPYCSKSGTKPPRA